MERVLYASTSSKPGTQESKKELDWRISFGFWTKLDALYQSFPPPVKPRCPALPHDSVSEWQKRLVSDDINQFLGNPAAASCLRTITNMNTATNVIISGGQSTGKSTFAGILRKTLSSGLSEHPYHFATLDASKFTDKVLLVKLEDAIRRLDASKTGSTSFLTIERFERITPSVQQHFVVPLLTEANLKKVFVILLVRPDTNNLAEQLKSKAIKVHLLSLSADLVRTKLLLICQQEQIGYTREGLEKLIETCSFKLLACMEKLHEIFLKQYFISQANVLKICQPANSRSNSPSAPPFPLSILRMSEPLRRCPKCTLLPPCSHVPLEKLFAKINQARALYPKFEREGTIAISINPDKLSMQAPGDNPPATSKRLLCPSFMRTGICANVKRLGRCRYAHPLAVHTINTSALVPRCRVHTLPLPCLHCSNGEQLKLDARNELAECGNLKHELRRSQQTLAELETKRYALVHDRVRTTKWGGAKKAADEQLARIDAALSTARTDFQQLECEVSSRQEALEKLQDAVAHGRSHGLGKGHGRLPGR